MARLAARATQEHIPRMTTTLDNPAGYLTVQFLTWVSEAPRTYGDAMDAWRTSCPRLSIWDDAIRDGLVRMEKGGGPMRQSLVKLTDRGRIVLKQRNGPAR
jgi:hypothetical protein